MAMMLNNYTLLVGFIKRTPKLVEDENYKGKCCLFTICTKDHKSVKEVLCFATGMLVEQLMVYGKQGSFWAVGGILGLHRGKNNKKVEMSLKCVEIELLKRPVIPSETVEEFVGDYSPKEIVKRARERKKK